MYAFIDIKYLESDYTAMIKKITPVHEHGATCRHLETTHSSHRELRFTTKEKKLYRGSEGMCKGCEHECGAIRVIGARGRFGAWRIAPVKEPIH